MNSPKELFLKKDDLRTQLGAVVSQDWFRECVYFTVAQMHEEATMTAEQMKGARMFIETLCQMHQKDEPPQDAISTGLKPVKPLQR